MKVRVKLNQGVSEGRIKLRYSFGNLSHIFSPAYSDTFLQILDLPISILPVQTL